MFFELHNEHKIAYKKLSEADLGIVLSSNQTHIGLSERLLDFLPNRDVISEDAIFIYEDSFDYIDAYFDRIKRPNGTFRSPKIRIGDRGCISVVSTIRNIAKNNDSNEWFLLWFGLKNEKIVFFLFNNLSNDYQQLSGLGLNLNLNGIGVLDDKNLLFNALVQYLETKVNETGSSIIKELEVVSQIEDKTFDKRFKRYDIVKANRNFRKIGRHGEKLVNDFLATQKDNGEITDYFWYNDDGESGLPYDFHIECTNANLIYLDVKTTKFDFEQEMIFSNQEMEFISNTEYGYCVYRVYQKAEQHFSLRICDNCKEISSTINSLTNDFKNNLLQVETGLRSAKFAIAPTNEKLKFEEQEFLLNVV